MADLPPWQAPFKEQIDYFSQKMNLPSSSHADIVNAGHDKGFMVSGLQSADLLADLNNAVQKAIKEGTGLVQFRKDFNDAVLKDGWHGWAGEGSKAGFNWRTRVIYTTNMAQSYEAGRRQQMLDPDVLKTLPYWQYKHDDSVAHPRPEHQAWDGLTLPPDHHFWIHHYTKNGYGCQCRVVPVSKATYLKAIAKGRGPANAPDAGDVSGIDPGFAHAPGAGIDMALREAVSEKLIHYPPAIALALAKDTAQYLDARHPVGDFVKKALTDKAKRQIDSWRGFVTNAEKISAAVGQDVAGAMVTIPASTVRSVAFGDLGPLDELIAGELTLPGADDYTAALPVLAEADSLIPVVGVNPDAPAQFIAEKIIGKKHYTALYEVRDNGKTKTLALLALALKTV